MNAKILVSALFLIASFSINAFSVEGADGYVEIEIEYRSSFPGYLQIKDEVCKPPRLFECEKARIKLQSGACRQKKQQEECRESEDILETSYCLPGLIYESRIVQGEKIRLSVCKSLGGFGNVSLRDLDRGQIWTSYHLLNDGDTIKYP